MKILKIIFSLIITLTISVFSHAQGTISSVSGKVVDENNAPLPGVSVKEVATSNSTTTDFDGNFKIKVASKTSLAISFVGYKTQNVKVEPNAEVKINLVPAFLNLNEVVVVGYGKQKKALVTGAISKVKAADFENQPINRIEQVLQGRTSGVFIAQNSGQPGASSTVRIRGVTTLNDNSVLWVVDGIVIDAGEGIGYLNPNDIESTEVLKDAAAQAIYGTRAANGVILVTTKGGRAGKFRVNYNGFTGFSSPARKLNLLNAEQYATLTNEAAVAGGNPIKFPNPAALGAGTDWQGTIFNRSAFRQSHDVSVSGGNDVSTFYLSFGLVEQDGIVATEISRFNRKNIRLNSNHKISKYLTIGQTASFTTNYGQGFNGNTEFGGPLSSAINLDPTTPLIETNPLLNTNGQYALPNIIRDEFGNPYGISNIITQEIVNPIAGIKTNLGNTNFADNFVANAFAELSPLKGLKFRSTIAAKLANYGGYSFTPVSYLNSSTITAQNNVSINTNRNLLWNVENTLTYSKKINNHDFSFLVGQGAYVENIASGSGVTKLNIPAYSYLDASINLTVPDAQIKSYAYQSDPTRTTSYFARLNYNYGEKYLFTGVFRRDGSTKFGANNKFGDFPSFSLGWVTSKESFWKENNYINVLKFRGGYGKAGNDRIDNRQYESFIAAGSNYAIGNTSIAIGNNPSALANPNLKWEETTQTNVGLDAVLFKYFTVSLDFYNKNTTGILRRLPVPGYVGTDNNPTYNVGSMTNKGFDLEVGFRKKIGQVNCSINANLSKVRNEVTSLLQGQQFITDGERFQSSTDPITRTAVGESINSFFGYQNLGIFQNANEINAYTNSGGTLIQPNAVPGDFKWQDTNGDGKIDANDRVFLGKPTPDYTFGFTLNLEYKGIDFTLFAQGVAGNQIFQGYRRLDIAYANYQTTALGRWTGEGTSNTFPRLTSNDTNQNFGKPSNFYIQNGDYLRIKTVQIGYTIPAKITNIVGLSKTRIYVSGENLYTFTKYSGYDPEIGGNVQGIDKGYYPQARTLLMGLNLQF